MALGDVVMGRTWSYCVDCEELIPEYVMIFCPFCKKGRCPHRDDKHNDKDNIKC